ncbi:recombinase family protein, partial [Acetobacter indonesiensis]
QAILDGVPGSRLKERIGQLEARKAEIEARLADTPSPPPLLHPNMAELYRQKVATLHDSLQNETTGTRAREALRSLITRIRLIPENGVLGIFLEGDLAAMLSFASNKKNAEHHPDA